MPFLDKAVQRLPPVVVAPKIEDAIFSFNLLSATGTALLLAGVIAGLLLGVSRATWLSCMPNIFARSRLAPDHCCHAGARIYDSIQRHRHDHGPCAGWHRSFVPFLLASHRMARGRLNRKRYSFECFVRQSPASYRETSPALPVLMASANSSGGVMGKMMDLPKASS